MIKKLYKRNFSKKAFSMIEMSIVLLIVAIIVSGALTVSTSLLLNAKTKATKERMDEIYRALGRFMLKNYRLPCPASLLDTKNTADYGTELGTPGACATTGVYSNSDISADIFYGMVPVKTLGLPDDYAEDGFGNKIAYVIHQAYSLSEYPLTTNNGGFSYADPGIITLPAVISMPAEVVVGNNAFVLISQGANKQGSFNANAEGQNSSAQASTYELQNMLSNIVGADADFGAVPVNPAVVTFVSSDSDSEVFDDVVFYKSRDQMVADFDGFFLLPCVSPDAGFVVSYYGTTQYRTTNCPMPNDTITPTMTCGPFGAWIAGTTCP